MLTWPVFQGRFSDQQLAQNIFRPTNIDTSDDVIPHGIDMLTKESSIQPLDEERIPILLNRFLENVHTKNPILDTDILIRYGREAAANGLGWDAPSCLVLLACALGAVSQPFSISIAESPRLVSEPQATSISIFKRELHQAESYYILACRRLGLLRHNILSSHCFFFSGGTSKSPFQHPSLLTYRSQSI